MMDGGGRLVKGSISTVIEPGPDIIHHSDKLSTGRREEGRGEGMAAGGRGREGAGEGRATAG